MDFGILIRMIGTMLLFSLVPAVIGLIIGYATRKIIFALIPSFITLTLAILSLIGSQFISGQWSDLILVVMGIILFGATFFSMLITFIGTNLIISSRKK
jgi:hypothetical protein